MKNAKALEKSCLLIKGVTETVRNEVKELKGGYLGMLAATLGSDYQEIYKQVKELLEQLK